MQPKIDQEKDIHEDISKKRLGRGLAALIGTVDVPLSSPSPDTFISIDMISPNPKNPRQTFSEDHLSDLVQSIRERGVVQPIIVRPNQTSKLFEIIAGERRWRAAQRAGLLEIPVIIKEVDDKTALELAIIENVQRADLNAIEEACGYQKLIDEHHYTQADLAQIIGKSRSHIANTLRLLKLPHCVHEMLFDNRLSAGHARALINTHDPEGLAKRIVEEGLSVRQTEALSQNDEIKIKIDKDSSKSIELLSLEKLLTNIMGLKVHISQKKNGGEVRFSYKNHQELAEFCKRLQETIVSFDETSIL